MRGKWVNLVCLLVFFAADALSQDLSHQVLVPAANVIVAGAFNYSQTIGETAVEKITKSDFTLTQGFQQPRILYIIGTPPPGTGVDIGPVPATDYINMKFWGEKSRSFTISIINLNGRIVYTEELKLSDNYYYLEQISVSNLVSGFYFVRVISDDGAINRSFKLEKI